MGVTITGLTFVESGGFAGLLRGCTLEPAALPEVPRVELQNLAQQTTGAAWKSGEPGPFLHNRAEMPDMRDMQVYTLELVMQPSPDSDAGDTAAAQHRVLRFSASDVPENAVELIQFLRDRARPLER